MFRFTPLALLCVALAGATEPGNPQLSFAYGVLEQQRGNDSAAEAAFEKALKEAPSSLPLVSRVVKIRMENGDVDGARALYRKLAEQQPTRIPVQLEYVSFLGHLPSPDEKVWQEMKRVLEAAHRTAPRSVEVTRQLFQVYGYLEQRDPAMRLYQELISQPDLTPPEVMAVAEQSRALFESDDRPAQERVDELFRTAMSKYARSASFARAASERFRSRRNLREAIGMLALHVAAQPSSLDLRTRLGVLMLSAGRQEDGEKELLAVVAIDPRHGLANQSLAKLYRQEDQTVKALPYAAAALKSRGGSASDFLELATEFLDAGQPRESRLLLEKAVYFNPEDAELAAKLAIATRRDPDTRAQASRLFREAEQMSGKDGPAAAADFLVESAEALLDGGQKPAAEERLRQAIRAFSPEDKKPMSAAMRRLAGLWQEQGKNGEAAASLLKRADSLDPSP